MNDVRTDLSAASLSVLLQSGALDPVVLIEKVLERIEHADPAIFTEVLAARAVAEAQASRKRLAEGRSVGLLDGVPIAWKDLFDTRGSVTRAGSVVLAGPPAERDATVVDALCTAGMVAVGRTNMSEFAFSGLGINPHYGTPVNAASAGPGFADDARVPGGSSSGSAVAVAAGLVPVAIGTDTGGSIRIPAAFNGIVGYKATRGRYAMAGVFPLAASLDSLGPLCRTVKDAVWVDAAMRGATVPDTGATSLHALTLVVPETVMFDDAEDGVLSAFEAALSRLAAKGARIERRPVPLFSDVFALFTRHGTLVTAEAFALHRDRLAGPDAARMDPRVATRIRMGEKIGMADYVALVAARQGMIAAFSGMLGPNELLAHPTLPHVAPRIAPLLADDALFVETNGRTLRNTLVGNFLDSCGVSIPCGTGDAGLPVGFLLSAPRGEDRRLLSAALAAEPVIRGNA
jgi:aspartyl-tRNA(Asn)/glutamyl-tRNA(Gln) amidotransferase subunit A